MNDDDGDRAVPEDETRPPAGGGGEGERNDELSTVEVVTMVASVLFTLALFAFALWQTVTAPGVVAPSVDVTGQEPIDGGVAFTVELRNRGGVGLVQTTIAANCTDPPVSLTFQNVPAGGRRVGTLVCPPGTTEPGIAVESWRHG